MPPSRIPPLVVVLAGLLWVLCGHAQDPKEVGSPTIAGQTSHLPGDSKLGAPAVPVDTPVVPFSGVPDSLGEWPWNDSSAARAARVDPGILIYTEPPAGTDMPILRPPEDVDPEMVWPGKP